MNKGSIILLAAGGHGSVVLDALLASGSSVSGILDPGRTVGSLIFNVPVLGGDDLLDQINPADVLLVNGIGANPFNSLRSYFSKNGGSMVLILCLSNILLLRLGGKQCYQKVVRSWLVLSCSAE